MLIKKDLFKRIDDIVESAYLSFIFELIGDDFFSDEQKQKIEHLNLIIGRKPLMELLYVLIKNRPAGGYPNDKSLSYLLDSVALSGHLPIITDTQQATVDDSKSSFMESLETAKADLKRQVRQKIISINKQYKQDVAAHRYTNISEENKKQTNYTSLLLAALPAIVASVHDSFSRSFTTNLTDMINDSTVDRITDESVTTGKLAKNVRVFKSVINDSSLCNWCHAFYVDKDGTPTVYKLSDLQANGSNLSRPKSEWKPVLGATHPRCRCQLHILKIE